MRSVYALIPAALLAGTVASASAEAKTSRVEDAEAHRQSWNTKHKYYKSNTKLKAAIKPGNLSKAHKRKPWNLASANPKLVYKKKDKIARVPVTETPRVAAASEAVDTPEAASIDLASMTKTLRSGPRDPGKPIAPARLAISQFRIKPNETNDTAYVVDIIRELAPSYGVPTWFAMRIASVESGYDPYAHGLAGEIGVYQLKCETALHMGFTGECHELIDARTNVRWGLKHLSLAIGSSGGDLQLAASKHNGGLRRKSLIQNYIGKVFLISAKAPITAIAGPVNSSYSRSR